jgi:hypothetical protein
MKKYDDVLFPVLFVVSSTGFLRCVFKYYLGILRVSICADLWKRNVALIVGGMQHENTGHAPVFIKLYIENNLAKLT